MLWPVIKRWMRTRTSWPGNESHGFGPSKINANGSNRKSPLKKRAGGRGGGGNEGADKKRGMPAGKLREGRGVPAVRREGGRLKYRSPMSPVQIQQKIRMW